ncbi:hypothetical protein F4861DRAFT_327659 [Xylaria intraflava]|nr:hypothetical protein F4861DRAFT_327659 [Xylaria intraflava]
MTAPSVLVHYITTAATLSFLTSRVVLSLWRREPIDVSFVLVITSVVIMIGTVAAYAFILRFGNAYDARMNDDNFDGTDMVHIKIGSILVLVSRVLITIFIWLQIAILLFFYTRITLCVYWVSNVTKFAWAFFFASLIGITLVTFLECRPFHLYLQVTPNPGHCVHAYGQLLAQAASNVVLDLLLIIIAWPIMRLKKRTLGEYVTLYAMFTLGTFCIIISIIRVIAVHDSDSSQRTRLLWASVQMMVSAFVANGPHVYGSIRVIWAHRSPVNNATIPEFYFSPKERERRKRFLPYSWTVMNHDPNSRLLLPQPPPRTYASRPLTTFYDEETALPPYCHPMSYPHFK